jgi:hypothetical protein
VLDNIESQKHARKICTENNTRRDNVVCPTGKEAPLSSSSGI